MLEASDYKRGRVTTLKVGDDIRSVSMNGGGGGGPTGL